MLIPIRLPLASKDDLDDSAIPKRARPSVSEELLLVELQGDVVPRKDKSLDGLPLGTLTEYKDGKATLVIGNHLLDGTMEKLPKPFLAVRKVVTSDNSTGDSPASDKELETKVAYDIVSLVRRKFIFASVPTPLNRHDPRVKNAFGVGSSSN